MSTAQSTEQTSFSRRLHIDPTISVGHILTTLTIAVSVIWWASTVETRLSNHDIRFKALEEADQRAERTRMEERRELREELKEIKLELKEMNAKLGRR